MKVLFAGGGTLGSVTPLIAIYQEIQQRDFSAEFLWLATQGGPELQMLEQYEIAYQEIPSGKLRRYLSVKNITDLFRIMAGRRAAKKILQTFKPDVVISAGGYVAVPVAQVAKKLGIPVVLHQPDVDIGLANKLMIKYASVITTGFAQTVEQFPKEKTRHTGTPVRTDIFGGVKQHALESLGLATDVPTLLVIGGGTGSEALNKATIEALPKLIEFCQVIHLTGGKIDQEAEHSRYRGMAFASNQLRDLYAAADLVISRAGVGVLAELTALRKASVLVPLPNSPQETNAAMYFNANAALVIKQENLDAERFAQATHELLTDDIQLQSLSANMKKMMPIDSAKQIVDMIV